MAPQHRRSVSPDGNLILDIYWESPGGTIVTVIVTLRNYNQSPIRIWIENGSPLLCQEHPNPYNSVIHIIATPNPNAPPFSLRPLTFTCRAHAVIAEVNSEASKAQATAILD